MVNSPAVALQSSTVSITYNGGEFSDNELTMHFGYAKYYDGEGNESATASDSKMVKFYNPTGIVDSEGNKYTFETDDDGYVVGTFAGSISPKPLTVTITGSISKEYDGTATVDATTLANLTASLTASEIVGSEDVEVDAITADEYTGSAAGDYNVTLTVTLKGDDKDNYIVKTPVTATGKIEAKTLDISKFKDVISALVTKEKNFNNSDAVKYATDGKTSVTLSGTDILTEDVVVASIDEDSKYSQSAPGNGLTITLTPKLSNTNYTFGTTNNTISITDGAIKAKITYNKNGHGTQTVTSPQYFAVGSTIDVPSLTEDGYQFDGWYTDAEFKTQWTSTSTVTGNTNLYENRYPLSLGFMTNKPCSRSMPLTFPQV